MGDADERVAAAMPELDFQSRLRELRAAHRRRQIARHRSLLLHWMGRWLRRSRRPHADPLPTIEPGQVSVTFAGHATALIRYADRNIVCDPMLGRWVKGVKRAVAPGLSPADLHDVNLILISHAHADHLHRPTLTRMPRSATIIVPPRTAQHVSDLGFARVVELRVGQAINDYGIDITTAAVRHGDEAENQAVSYVIRGDGPSVYFCGDSGYFEGFAEVGAQFRPDIALLPIGGYAPLSFRDRHMSPLDALYALEDVGARIMIPIHHGAFALSYEQLHEPSRWLAELTHERALEEFVVELQPGESRVFVPPRTASLPATRDAASPGSGGKMTRGSVAGAAGPAGAPDGRWPLPPIPAYVRMRAVPRPRRAAVPKPAPGRAVAPSPVSAPIDLDRGDSILVPG